MSGVGGADPCWASAVELAARLRRREISAVELLDAVLARADEVGPAINPFCARLDERARLAAQEADAALGRSEGGPLCGVPMTVKDSQWMAGVESAYGSRAMVGFVPRETCTAVERLEAAGAVIFAKTTMPEFGYAGITASELHGVTSNPWDLSRTPGGSSGGAGAAIAAGLGPVSMGGDGGGSIRIPAAFCGVFGFKPTFGLIPREPASAGWKTLVALGPLSRSVADARLVVKVTAGMDPRDRHSLNLNGLGQQPPALKGLRVVASEDLGFAALDEDVRRAFRSAVERLEAEGVEVVWDAPGLASSVEVWATLACANGRYAEAPEFEQRRELLDPHTIEFLELGESISASEYIAAELAREGIYRAYLELFERTGAQVLLTPTLGCEAFPHGLRAPQSIGERPITPPWLDWAPFLYDANLAGLPALAFPIGLGEDGLPVSMQLLGRRGADGTVLATAEAFEAVLDPAASLQPPAPEGSARPQEVF